MIPSSTPLVITKDPSRSNANTDHDLGKYSNRSLLQNRNVQYNLFDAPVCELSEYVERNPILRSFIELSISKAAAVAQECLEEKLFRELDWPKNLPEYLSFLNSFVKWKPRQSGNPAFFDAEGMHEHREVYIRLCHFHFLIDQPIVNHEKVVQRDEWFQLWLIRYMKFWGAYLDTTESFTVKNLNSFIKYSPAFRVQDSLINGVPNDPKGWHTFNQFFARRLNPGLRPIFSPESNAIVSSPADCKFVESFPITENSTIPEVEMKMTHRYDSIGQLLDGSPYAESFAGGIFAHYFLNTFSYHRFHAPVSGKLLESRTIQGLTILDVILDGSGQFSTPVSSSNGFEFYQSRGLTIFDTTGSSAGDIGLVAFLPVGMGHVSSVVMTASVNREMNKGDDIGYFQFGGSDVIVLFQKKAQAVLDKEQVNRKYGSAIASCNTSGQSS